MGTPYTLRKQTRYDLSLEETNYQRNESDVVAFAWWDKKR
jgi:hypothetical protein